MILWGMCFLFHFCPLYGPNVNFTFFAEFCLLDFSVDLNSSRSNAHWVSKKKMSSLSSIYIQHYCGRNTIFSVKTPKTRAGCFQSSKVTNYVHTKARTKAKYQTSHGQNMYSSSLLFSGLNLSNIICGKAILTKMSKMIVLHDYLQEITPSSFSDSRSSCERIGSSSSSISSMSC